MQAQHKAIHFGAGNIGRGFIGSLLSLSGYHVTFVDIHKDIVTSLHREQEYQIKVVGDKEEIISIAHVDAVLNTDESLPKLIATAHMISCAVGPKLLVQIAPTIIQGLLVRMKKKNTSPLHIIACENMLRASSALKHIIFSQCSIELTQYIQKHVFFLDSVVDRIVPTVTTNIQPTTSLSTPMVTVESFFEWCIEDMYIQNDFLPIQGTHLVKNLQAYLERKLFTLNTAHAYIAWLGYIHTLDTIYDCMQNSTIVSRIQNICQETATLLIQKHGFDKDQHMQYVHSILERFKNPYLHDSIYRTGRSPILKLSEHERFIMPLQMALQYKSPYQEILRACASGLHFFNKADKESVELQRRLQEQSPSAVFQQVSGIQNTKILTQIEELYYAIKQDLV